LTLVWFSFVVMAHGSARIISTAIYLRALIRSCTLLSPLIGFFDERQSMHFKQQASPSVCCSSRSNMPSELHTNGQFVTVLGSVTGLVAHEFCHAKR
jgi:hypothetical protein